MGASTLSLPSLAGSITSVSFSLAGGLVFNHPRYPGVFGGLSGGDLGRGGGLNGCLLLRRKSFASIALNILDSFPFCMACLAGFNKRDALRLSGGL